MTDDPEHDDIVRQFDAILKELFAEVQAMESVPLQEIDQSWTSLAPRIEADSWLMQDRFADFRLAYQYAASKSRAIPGLSMVTAEHAYFIWLFIQRGMERQFPGKDST